MRNIVVQVFLVIILVHQNIGQLRVADYNRYFYDVPTHVGLYSFYSRLAITRSNGATINCSGALLTNQWIITSCKWLSNARTVTVHLGSSSIDGHVFNIHKRNIIHATSETDQTRSSIQLIKLPTQIKYTEAIQRINLPRDCELTRDNEIFIVDLDSTQSVDNFQSIASNIVSMTECTGNPSNFHINKFTYCIRGKHQQSKHHGHILIQPQGKELIGILNDHSSQRAEFAFTFHHILEYSQFIANTTGLSLPNCDH